MDVPLIFKYVNDLFNHQFWIPSFPNSLVHTTIDSGSWFRFSCFLNPNPINFSPIGDPTFIPTNETVYHSYKIKFYPTDEQKVVFHNWFESYRIMCNETNKKIKQLKFETGKYVTNWKTLRDKHMKPIKANIISIHKLPAHIADCAIKDVCAKYKSSISNGHKRFRIRYKKQSSPNKYFNTEIQYISKEFKHAFCIRILGNTIHPENNFSLHNITSDFTIQYKSLTDTYYLVIPEEVYKKTRITTKTIGLDIGGDTFLTGYTDDKCIKIGHKVANTIWPILRKIDRINNTVRNNELKSKLVKKQNIKLENLIDELHWKVINYLTKNYGTIYLGNLSTKRIVSKKCNLPEKWKRIMLALSVGKFKDRLKYKCKAKGVELHLVNEYMTSKTCGLCYNINKNLKETARIFECSHVNYNVQPKFGKPIKKKKFKIDRDMNGARNIMLRGIYENRIKVIWGNVIN